MWKERERERERERRDNRTTQQQRKHERTIMVIYVVDDERESKVTLPLHWNEMNNADECKFLSFHYGFWGNTVKQCSVTTTVKLHLGLFGFQSIVQYVCYIMAHVFSIHTPPPPPPIFLSFHSSLFFYCEFFIPPLSSHFPCIQYPFLWMLFFKIHTKHEKLNFSTYCS